MAIFDKIKRSVGIMTLILGLIGVSRPTQAATIAFTGGSCEVTVSTGIAVNLQSCLNLTGHTADNIELVATVKDRPEVAPTNIIYNQNFFCGFSDNCFGSAVAPGGTWVPDGIVGITIFSAHSPPVEPGDVILTGNWTMGSTALVPEPSTWTMMLFGMGMIGLVTRRNVLRAVDGL
jgi:hypothetical protein